MPAVRGEAQKEFFLVILLLYTFYPNFYKGLFNLHLSFIQISEDSDISVRFYSMQDFFASYGMQNPEFMLLTYFETI